jgi:predicted N-acetyltransferase YhbS
MELKIRRAKPEDAPEIGRICYEAFKAVAEQHGFPPDIPSAKAGIGVISSFLSNPGFYGVVGEADGKIVGSNFLDERSTIAGLGPVTVDPGQQNKTAGRQLMDAIMDRARAKNFAGVRLVHAAYHIRALALYVRMGFQVREPLACIQGEPPRVQIAGCRVRAATEADLAACNRLCFAVHGHDRAGELRDAVTHDTALVVERDGRISGYASHIGYFGHAVGESNDDLKALIGETIEIYGLGLLLPSRNRELFAWCLANGLRVTQTKTLMSTGFYNEPAGAFLPSILY